MGLIREESGVVFVEFLMAFTPVFVLFLGAVQLGLLTGTKLAVEHAAVVGARAAMVIFEDHPDGYGGEPRRQIAAPSGAALSNPMTNLVAPAGSLSRADSVRQAVALVLAPFAPQPSGSTFGFGRGDLVGAVSGWLARLVFGLTEYPRLGLAVTFPTGPESPVLARESIDGAEVTVRVTYLAACVVPLAARLVCGASSRDLAKALEPSRAGPPIPFVGGRTERDPDLQHIADPDLVRAALLKGARFSVLRAEATMPLQSAGYTGGAS
jgi:hypothetical protein